MTAIDLTELDRLYLRFQRSLRPFRALAGTFLSGVVLIPAMALVLPFEAGIFIAALAVVMTLLWLSGYIAMAAAVRSVLIVNAVLLSIWLVARTGLALWVMAMQMDSLALQAVILAGTVVNVLILATVIRGLGDIGVHASAEVRALVASDVGRRGFLRSPGQALRDFCRIAGLVVPPGPLGLPVASVLAALLASALEGAAYYQYLKLGYGAAQRHRPITALSEQWGEVPTTIFVIGMTAFGLFLCYLCLRGGRWLRAWAQRRALMSAEVAREQDSRPPVLFLRAFRDDQVALDEAPVPWYARFFDPGVAAGTLEALILRVFTPVGPVVALGRPGDVLPPVGAARSYLREGDWKPVIGTLIDEAGVIIVGLDDSPGLRFELEEIAARGARARAILIVPPSISRDHALIAQCAGHGLGAAPNGHAVVAILYDGPGHPVTLHVRHAHEFTYELALRFVLRPRSDLARIAAGSPAGVLGQLGRVWARRAIRKPCAASPD